MLGCFAALFQHVLGQGDVFCHRSKKLSLKFISVVDMVLLKSGLHREFFLKRGAKLRVFQECATKYFK